MSSTSDQPPAYGQGLGHHLLAAARADERSATSTEDSTLFSLERLMAGAPPSGDGFGSADDEDSGLIDLRALARGAPSTPSGHAAALWLGDGDFPLGPPSPTEPPLPVTPAARQPRHGAAQGLTVLLATAVVGLVATIGFVLMRGPTVVARAEPAMPRIDAAAWSVRSPAAASGQASGGAGGGAGEAATPGLAAGSASADAGSRPAAARRPARTGTTPPPASPTTAPTTTARSPKPGACPCPADDLLCHMHCTAGR